MLGNVTVDLYALERLRLCEVKFIDLIVVDMLRLPSLPRFFRAKMIVARRRDMIQTEILRCRFVVSGSLELAFDASEVLLAGPVCFGPDVAHGFPDVSVRFVSPFVMIKRWDKRKKYLT